MGEPSKLSLSSVNLVVRELLPERDSSLKIGVVVAEDCPTWAIVIPSLGYQLFKIYPPERFRNLRKHLTKKGASFMSCFVE